jgi:hypothetical protein
MLPPRSKSSRSLKLRAGDWVEVRSQQEILATLDERACLEAMPLMPEMLKYCGRRFRVFKSAHKTCDTIEFGGARKLDQTVHLEGLRCDGEFHDGCQAGCLMFWKEAWLKRVDPQDPGKMSASDSAAERAKSRPRSACTVDTVMDSARRITREGEREDVVYRCQATELNRASSVLPWWDFRQYIRDVSTDNIRVSQLGKALLFRLFQKLLRIGAYRALLWTYDTAQKKLGGIPYPYKTGTLEKTPRELLNLRPGEWVQVKTQEEILRTVNRRNRNRGLSFDEEMVEFCGGTYQVLRRVEKIINERTGRMSHLPGECIILDGVTCQSRFKDKRLFCPRSIFPYWREIWLKRVGPREEA